MAAWNRAREPARGGTRWRGMKRGKMPEWKRKEEWIVGSDRIPRFVPIGSDCEYRSTRKSEIERGQTMIKLSALDRRDISARERWIKSCKRDLPSSPLHTFRWLVQGTGIEEEREKVPLRASSWLIDTRARDLARASEPGRAVRAARRVSRCYFIPVFSDATEKKRENGRKRHKERERKLGEERRRRRRRRRRKQGTPGTNASGRRVCA